MNGLCQIKGKEKNRPVYFEEITDEQDQNNPWYYRIIAYSAITKIPGYTTK